MVYRLAKFRTPDIAEPPPELSPITMKELQLSIWKSMNKLAFMISINEVYTESVSLILPTGGGVDGLNPPPIKG
jgi:hypothetical protein